MVVDDIVRRILGLADFLENDRFFAAQLIRVEDRMLNHVGDQIDGERQGFAQNASVKRRLFPPGPCV